MNEIETRYVNLVNRIKSGQKEICLCANCSEPLYYGDTCYRFDGEILCEECFKTMCEESFKHKLGDKDIFEPDWDEE